MPVHAPSLGRTGPAFRPERVASPVPRPDKDIPISRAVGRFFGHLWHAAAKPPPEEASEKTKKQTVRKTTEETTGELQGRPVVLRRTTIEEIEIRDDRPPGERSG